MRSESIQQDTGSGLIFEAVFWPVLGENGRHSMASEDQRVLPAFEGASDVRAASSF